MAISQARLGTGLVAAQSSASDRPRLAHGAHGSRRRLADDYGLSWFSGGAVLLNFGPSLSVNNRKCCDLRVERSREADRGRSLPRPACGRGLSGEKFDHYLLRKFASEISPQNDVYLSSPPAAGARGERGQG